MRKVWFFVFLVVVCLGLPSWSLAQTEAGKASIPTSPESSDQFTCPVTSGPIFVMVASPIGKGVFAIKPYWYVTFRGSQFDDGWRTVSAGQDLISLSNAVNLYYGLTENFWITIFKSYYIHTWVYNIQNPGIGQGRTAQFGENGPLSLTLRYRFLKQKRFRPTVTGMFSLGFPTTRGSGVDPGTLPAEITSSRNWAFTWGINLQMGARPVILYANLWYFMATIDKRENLIDGIIALKSFNPRDQIQFNLAVEIPLRWAGGPWVVLLEMNSFWEVEPIFSPGPERNPSAKVTTLIGIEYILSPEWRFALGCSFDLFGKNTTKNFTPTFTIYKPLKLFKRKRSQG